MTDKPAIAQIVAVIATAYPNFQVKEQTYEIYWQLLQDIPEEELKAAVLNCLAESGRKFAPSIGEIRGAVQELRALRAGVPSAYEAWNEVLNADRSEDKPHPISWASPLKKHQWKNPLAEQAAKLLGWPQFPYGDNMAADRARFIECYEGLVEKASRGAMMLPDVARYLEVHGQVQRLTDALTRKG